VTTSSDSPDVSISSDDLNLAGTYNLAMGVALVNYPRAPTSEVSFECESVFSQPFGG